MREIKFRAWNKYNNNRPSRVSTVGKMIHQDDFWFHDIKFPFKTEIHQEYGSYFIMQYTGLKDKNGVEVYEGDVVAILDCEPSLYKIVWWENNFKYGVEYIGADKTNWNEENLEEFDSELIEVIGNIYENPELLNKEGSR